jgi:hypothetical protein
VARLRRLVEAQPGEQRLRARLRLVAADVVVMGHQLRELLAVRIGHRAFQLAQLHVAVHHEVERRPRHGGRLLRHVREHPPGGSDTSPESACNSRRTSAKRLDLPLPLGPMSPTFWPGWTFIVARSSSTRRPFSG